MDKPLWELLGIPKPDGYPHRDWAQGVYLNRAVKRVTELEAEVDALSEWKRLLLAHPLGDTVIELQAEVERLRDAQKRVRKFPVALRKMWSGNEVKAWIEAALEGKE